MHTPRNARNRKRAFSISGILLGCFIVIQFIARPDIKNPAGTGDFAAPPEVKSIIKRACYDCHSYETNLRWYDKIAPVSWKVAEHIKEGRASLNFSNWADFAAGDQKAKMWEIVNQVATGAMPLSDYTQVHRDARVSKEDLAVLKNYVAGMVVSKPADSAKTNAAQRQFDQWQNDRQPQRAVPQAPNGVAYMPDYKNWQAISTTERFDNNTMRVIYGNDIAVKAIRENNIHPWPNGTVFAKVAWDQLEDKDGNVRTGEFKQVEYMIKDDKKYAATKGWGWARFKTAKLVPYGKNAMFTTECVNCHQPMSNEDFVFTMPVKF